MRPGRTGRRDAVSGLPERPIERRSRSLESTNGQWTIREGADVYGVDGEKVGAVVAVQKTWVIVERGFFFSTRYYVPTEAVIGVADGNVYLNVTKDQALNRGWDTAPKDADAAVTTVATRDRTGCAPGTGGATWTAADAPFEHLTDNRRSHVDGTEKIRVPVHEEELTAVTCEREIGEVRVEKDVVAEQRTIEVPVTEERVRVVRRTVDRPASADAATLEEGLVAEVPVRGEAINLQKRVRVAEEVELIKEQVRGTERVAGTVRREEVRIREDVATDTWKA